MRLSSVLHVLLPVYNTKLISASVTHGIDARRQGVPNLPGTWQLMGCFADNISARTFRGPSFHNDTAMSVETCVNFCNNQLFNFAGLEFGKECYCDNAFVGAATTKSNGECNQPCSGNQFETCGAANRLNVYRSGNPLAFPPPQVVGSFGRWQYLGCFTDDVNVRTLARPIHMGGVTPSTCVDQCFTLGFTHIGVEFGGECWCGNEVGGNARFLGLNVTGVSGDPPVRATQGGPFCDMPCVGDHNEICGGQERLSVYRFTGPATPSIPQLSTYRFLGCVSLQSVPVIVERFPVTVSAELCSAACGAGFSSFALTGDSRCLCTATPSGPLPRLDDSVCNIPCKGSPLELCGGPSAALLFTPF